MVSLSAKKRCIIIVYLAMENTVANKINATYAQCTTGRLAVIGVHQSINQSINQLIVYFNTFRRGAKNSFKIRTCINKNYSNYS